DPPVETEVLLIDTGTSLLVGFQARDPDPEAIRAFFRDRDAAYRDDMVGVVLDTFNDERRALQFFANAYGAQMDMINDDINGREDDSWDAIWDSAGRITEDGYVVEMEIPYTALQLPPGEGEKTWGIDLLRFYPRDSRHRISNNPLDRSVSCYLCQLGKVRGFEEADPGRDLEITPTITVTTNEFRDDVTDDDLQSGDTDVEPGLDVSWGVTPNINLSATFNPDFSQVEADVAQLDVNRTFALFFPEQRPFFLEGRDFFQTPENLVFTRNVADPDFGARVTGKVGRHGLGFFVADDTITNLLIPGALESDITSLEQSSNNLALRYRYDVGENSAVGLITTVRDSDGYRNEVYGVDTTIRFSEADTFEVQYLDSRTEYPEELVDEFNQKPRLSGSALSAVYNHNVRNWNAFAGWEDFDADFRADLGFVNQVDYSQLVVGGGYNWWGEESDWYDRIRLAGDYDETEDQSGLLLERELEAEIGVQGPLQSYLEVGAGVRERFWDGVLFDEDFYYFYGEAQPVSGLYVELFTRFGDQIDFANTALGEQTRYSPEVRWNLGKHWQFDLRHTYQTLERDGGTVFTANQSDFRIAYQFDLRQRLRLTLQYTDVERDPTLYVNDVDERFRDLSTQLIYSYKVNPRTVLYAGYSDSSIETDEVDSLTTMGRTLFMKVGYAWEPTF
ncbi:MAG: DUF5916 domain-containing protein, partial [Pseudomonadota bacterium]